MAGAREHIGPDDDGIHDTAECPSLSQNETRVAYKKDFGDGVPDWRVAVLDLASGVETVLP